MAAPTIFDSNNDNTIPPSVLPGQLILAFVYFEPSFEADPMAAYDDTNDRLADINGLDPMTLLANFDPDGQNSNDVNITSENTNRIYGFYKWADGSEGGLPVIFEGTNSTDFSSLGGVLVIDGAVDVNGGTTDDPVFEFDAESTNVGGGVWPTCSVTLADTDSLLLFVGSDWDFSQGGPPSGWNDDAGTNQNAFTTLYRDHPTSGVASIDVSTSNGDILLGTLMSFRSTAGGGGGSDFTGTAALTAGATLSAVGKPAVSKSAAFTCGATLTATAKPATGHTAALTAGAALSATGTAGGPVPVALTAGAVLSATGSPHAGKPGGWQIAISAVLSATGKPAETAAPSFTAGATLSTTETVTATGAAAFTAGAVLSSTTTAAVGGTVGLTAQTALSTTHTVTAGGVAALAAGAALTASGTQGGSTPAAFTAGTLLTVTASGAIVATAAFTAGSTLTVAGTASPTPAVSLFAGADLEVVGTSNPVGSPALTAAVVLTAVGFNPSDFRDLTLTYQVGTDRWGSSIGTDRWTDSVGSDRWEWSSSE